jgi:hypothetical protein
VLTGLALDRGLRERLSRRRTWAESGEESRRNVDRWIETTSKGGARWLGAPHTSGPARACRCPKLGAVLLTW